MPPVPEPAVIWIALVPDTVSVPRVAVALIVVAPVLAASVAVMSTLATPAALVSAVPELGAT